MKAIVLAAAILATFGQSAMAQGYYGDPGGYGPAEPYEDDAYGSPYGRPRYSPYEYGEPRRPYYRQTRRGSICVTARGSCEPGGLYPLNTPCGCYIPGFGQKRGAIGY